MIKVVVMPPACATCGGDERYCWYQRRWSWWRHTGSMAADFASAVRTWRERLTPDEVGLPVGPRRRTPGLRRSELALLAGVSVDYLVQLEQGRATAPSPQVVEALARALRLNTTERDHVFRLAGLLPPGPGVVSRHITPGVHRLIDRLRDVPVSVWDASWTMLLGNPLWLALVGPPGHGRHRNLPWRHFVLGVSRSRHQPDELNQFETALVSDLRVAAAEHPADHQLRDLIAALRARSARFAELWDAGVLSHHPSGRKIVVHPSVGAIALDCDVLTVPGAGDLRIVAYTAEPGSEAAGKLQLLTVVGISTAVTDPTPDGTVV
ncbi:helix-turn-helix domain-containing protein [Dactylosporangium sp. CA-139114]|uniref:helix-turn-helix domain-containing protein n=1 Tax=Dactylosporangium sp. CA-139114 TaxID=3239931 RepID=UPI003D969C5F